MKTKKEKASIVKNNTGSWGIFFILVILSFLLLLLTNNINQKDYSILNRTWGFDHIEYYPMYMGLIVVLLLLSTLFIFSYSRIYNAVQKWVSEKSGAPLMSLLSRYKIVFFLLFSIIAAVLFYLFRIKYIFLGDFEIRMDWTVQGEFHRDSYLTMFLLNKVYNVLNTKFGISAHSIFVLTSVICGGLFTFFTLLIADLLGKSRWQKIVIALFCVLNGSIFIYTGYIEIYPIPGLMVVISLYVSLLYIKDRLWFIVVILTVLVAAGMHLMSVASIPGILFIWAYKNKEKLSFIKLKRIHIILLVIISFPVLYTIAKRFDLIDIIPLKDSTYYNLFSGTHFWEFLNSQILAAGISFLLFIYILYSFLRKRVTENLILYFLLIQSGYYLFIVFVLNKMRGSTDCDITSFPSFVYSILIVYVFVHQLITRISKKDVFYILCFTLLFNALNSALWIGIISSDRSINKVASMIEGDPAHYYVNRMPSDLLLAMMYANNDLVSDALVYYEKSYKANYDDPRTHYNYANYLINHEQQEKGIMVLDNLTKVFPYYPLAYPVLVSYYQSGNRYQDIYRIAGNMFEGYKTSPESFDRLDKNFVVSIFSYLYEVTGSTNDTQLRNELAAVLAELNK
ncbi:tetratricopeptide repeat protein [Bacteroidota bacterium]